MKTIQMSAAAIFMGAALNVSADNAPTPYIFDYYDSGITPKEYLKKYQGKPFKGIFRVAKTGNTVIEAENFDSGKEGESWQFDKKRPTDYRADADSVAINKGGKDFVIGNITPGKDWFCYTVDVEKAGEYEIEALVSAPGKSMFHFEVDGNPSGEIVRFRGAGWSDYIPEKTAGIYLSKGKHVIKFIPGGAMNVDKLILTRVGEMKKGAAAGKLSFNYPRTSSYDCNPLFVDLTSPMMNCGFTGPLYTADPSAHVWNIDGKEVLYLYASHDMEPPRGCDYMDRYHIFSTEDMVNWVDHGEVMNAATSNAANGVGSDGFMWAPDCGYNPADKLYYFVYPHKLANNTHDWAIFVATSPNPAGPWTCKGYIEGVPPIIDPCLFVDDDGQPYLYVGGGGHCWGGKLRKDDWTKLDGPMKEMEGFTDFHEGPWIHKYNGKYYLSHPDNNFNNNHLQYSMSDSPLGPWTPKGMYMHAHGHDTTHGSIVKFKDKWYQFYHTADFGGRGNLRSVCFDEVKYNPDGTIQMINTWGEPFMENAINVFDRGETLIPAVKYNKGKNSQAYFTRDRQAPSRDADFVTLGNEEWLRFDIDVEKKGTYKVKVNLMPEAPQTKLAVLSNVEYLTDHSGVKVESGGIGKWGEMTIDVPLEEGKQFFELRVKEGPIAIKDFSLELKK